MTDLAARVASLEAEVETLRSAATGDQPSSRRALLRTAAMAAGAVGGTVLLTRPAGAADGSNLVLGSAADANNTATTPTTLTYGGTLTDRSALTVGPAAPNATAGNNVFPAAVGGYGTGAVANGVHGSTTVLTGFGVVAANVSSFAASGPGPVALNVVSGGGHIRFIGTIGDAVLGTYEDGTLAYNSTQGLFLTVIDGLGGTRNVLLADLETASAFRILPSPVRVYDSRTGTGPAATGAGKIAGGEIRDISLATGFTGGVEVELFVPRPPADGVMLNLTITETEGAGFLAVYSSALPTPPGTSNINWSQADQNLANLAISAIAAESLKVQAGGGGATHFVIDVVGVYG
jgi:hypothetical protein